MTFVCLIHWNRDEAAERARLIEAAGYQVEVPSFSFSYLRRLGDHPPVAVVIDLSRLPSHGREGSNSPAAPQKHPRRAYHLC